MVLACWHDKALDVVRCFAKQTATEAQVLLRRSVELAWADGWWALLAVAVQDALVGCAPTLDALLDGQRWSIEDGATGSQSQNKVRLDSCVRMFHYCHRSAILVL